MFYRYGWYNIPRARLCRRLPKKICSAKLRERLVLRVAFYMYERLSDGGGPPLSGRRCSDGCRPYCSRSSRSWSYAPPPLGGLPPYLGGGSDSVIPKPPPDAILSLIHI